jgi:AbrB family looped-hinge helix DNA binding protein
LTLTIKVVKVGNSLRMTIPKDVCRALDIKAGDMLEIGLSDNAMTVKKASGK